MLRILVTLCISFPLTAQAAQPVLQSSVSPEFPDGLHAKYLRYIAQKMDSDLAIYPMPFARRIDALKQGEIDIMVGLKNAYEEDGFVYLKPAYEDLRNTYFIRADHGETLQSAKDLSSLVVGVTIDNPASMLDLKGMYRAVVRVSSLRQKIQLLHLGRIDAFTHFESSTRLELRELGLDDEIIVADYQPGKIRSYYVGLSKQSDFYPDRQKLNRIIEQGVANGDFAALRRAHENAAQP
ncbi:substrate-binding periplasmic protein [Alteromonas halophila]|uniref:Solute-binding protein family 3/N-terminal domain-containing protein n=1 Tax=Alteromonas halophila TaxID=516698 RepID=A0A918JGZ2_9ALTE|nr:transporter substrate-binding domain-containing protein [Alteromonas halophila]GGW80296.1 hypothetical protein GCM10007391_11480 [Alteromonas halophila]